MEMMLEGLFQAREERYKGGGFMSSFVSGYLNILKVCKKEEMI
jgi:hypothetical protein